MAPAHSLTLVFLPAGYLALAGSAMAQRDDGLDADLEDTDDVEASHQPLNQPTTASGAPGGIRQRLGALAQKPYGQVATGAAGAGGLSSLLEYCNCLGGGFLASLTGADDEEEPLLFALTWAAPQRFGIAPSPRNGHSMVLIGMHLFIFGGGDETISFNDVHTLHVGTMTWDKPVVHGTLPSPRSRHTGTGVGSNMVVFGGVGGGNELHILEVDTMTW